MTSRDIILSLIDTFGEQLNRVPNCNSNTLRDQFGSGFLLGRESDINAYHMYIGIYSDTPEDKNPFTGYRPDAIWVLDDNAGMCIFLYEIQD